jgi:hypothetical protein
MTKTTNTARVAATAQNTTDAEKMLRDMAFVLKLTRRVREEMTAGRALAKTAPAPTERALVA